MKIFFTCISLLVFFTACGVSNPEAQKEIEHALNRGVQHKVKILNVAIRKMEGLSAKKYYPALIKQCEENAAIARDVAANSSGYTAEQRDNINAAARMSLFNVDSYKLLAEEGRDTGIAGYKATVRITYLDAKDKKSQFTDDFYLRGFKTFAGEQRYNVEVGGIHFYNEIKDVFKKQDQ